MLSVNITHSFSLQSTSQLSRVRRDGCKPRPDGVCRSSSFGAVLWSTRRQSQLESGPKQDDTIRVDGMGPQGRGQEDMNGMSPRGASECSKVKVEPSSGILS